MIFGHGDLVGSSSTMVYFFICRQVSIFEGKVTSSAWKKTQISAASILPVIGSVREAA